MKKVKILALHLGYGGVEKYIANLIFENPEKNLYHYRLASEFIQEMRW